MQSTDLVKIRIHENSEDAWIVWDICREEVSYASDAIVVCELCWVGVHQRCYGRELDELPEEDWYWERCRLLISLGDGFDEVAIQCGFCNEFQGAIVQVRPNEWAHLQWVHWIPEISLDRKTKQLVGEVDSRRWGIMCDIWLKVGIGAWLRWDYPNWGFSFHVRWATRRGVIKKWRDMKIMDDIKLFGNRTPIYCNVHYDLVKERMSEMKENSKTWIVDEEDKEDLQDEDYNEKDEEYLSDGNKKYTVKESKSILSSITGGENHKRDSFRQKSKSKSKLKSISTEISKKQSQDFNSQSSIAKDLIYLQNLRKSLLTFQSSFNQSNSFLETLISPSLPIPQSSSNLVSPLQIITLTSSMLSPPSSSPIAPSFVPPSPFSKLPSDTQFKLSGPLSKLLKISKGTRDEIVWSVAKFFTVKGLIDEAGNFMIYKSTELNQLLQKKVIQPKDIFDSLNRFLQPSIMINKH